MKVMAQPPACRPTVVFARQIHTHFVLRLKVFAQTAAGSITRKGEEGKDGTQQQTNDMMENQCKRTELYSLSVVAEPTKDR